MRISDLEVNGVYTIPLVVLSATVRETKAKKQYLSLEFFDGVDKISGNYWDWPGVNIPAANAILDVKAQVTTWQSAKQLNIKGMNTNHDKALAEFMPTSTHSIGDVYKEAYALITEVTNNTLRTIALNALEDLQGLWLTAPGAKHVHHAFVGGTLVHSLAVAKTAKAIAQVTQGCDVDLCVVGGMLHDIGKLFTYEMEGLAVVMTPEGMLLDHSFLGAEYITTKGLVDNTTRLLQHIILSHHGQHEYGAAVTPAFIEAHVVHHADMIDSAAEQIREAGRKSGESMLTEKLWALSNKPHFSPHFISEATSQQEENDFTSA